MSVQEFPILDEISDQRRIAAAIDAATERLRSLQHRDGHWCGELEGDTILESEYLLLLFYLGRAAEDRFRKGAEYVRRQQLPDGGWSIYAAGPTDLSASVKAYFVLKLAGDSPDAPHMVRSRSRPNRLLLSRTNFSAARRSQSVDWRGQGARMGAEDDRDVVRFLYLFTFLPKGRVEELAEAVRTAPEKREAQKVLAFEVTRIVHGEEVAGEMARAAEIVYHSEIKDLSDQTLAAVFASVPSTEVSRADLEGGIDLVDLLCRAKLAASKGEARRLIKNGGVYVNNVRVDGEIKVGPNHRASESFLVLRSGKKNYHLIRVVDRQG